MNIKQLLTKRNRKGQNYAQPIIYEWEDIISKELNIPIVDYSIIHKISARLNIHSSLFGPYKDTFRFVVNGKDCDEPMNNSHVIPCIIDFFENKNQLQEFYAKHSKNKIVLFSSPFDYYYLKKNDCPLNIGLFPYSISDKYTISTNWTEKKYDIVLTGRQDPLLYSFFKEYIRKHPKVTYVKRGRNIENDDNKTKEYYANGKNCLGSIDTREDFIKLQSQGKVTLYGVQGYDGFTKGFYHMTPHFLEIIACGCHVIAHYPTDADGIDAQFYEFNKFSPSIDTYEAFEKTMDHALSSKVDIDMYSAYLKKHYTSYRVKQLKEILKDL